MALQLTGTSTKYWSRPFGLTAASFGGQAGTGTGWTFCAWVQVTGALTGVGTGGTNIFGLGSLTSGAQWGLTSDNAQNIYALIIDDANNFQYANNNAFTIGQWTCIMGVFPSNATQTYYASNDTSPATSASSLTTASTFQNLLVGFQSTSSSGFGTMVAASLINVAELAVWRGVLGPAEAVRLFAGNNPLTISPSNLHSYYPLRGNLNDYGPNHIGLTPVGGAVANFVLHPPVNPIPTSRGAFAPIAPVTGTITAGTKKPTTSVSGNINEVGTISAGTKKPTTSVSGNINEVGTISAGTKKPVASLTAINSIIGHLVGSTKKPTTSINAKIATAGTVMAGTKKPTASLIGTNIQTFGTIAASTKKPITSILAAEGAIINAGTKKPQAIMFGSVSDAAIITAGTKKPTTSLTSAFTISGTITTGTKKPVTSLSAHYDTIAIITAGTKKPVTSITAKLNATGAITAGTKKPVASINGSNALHFQGTITAGTKKPVTSLNSSTSLSGPFITWIY